MEHYLLNSAACLAILLLFYKLLLENETMHGFKRFYLLSSVLLALIIPLITFTTYVEVPTDSLQQLSGSSLMISETDSPSKLNWATILWIIYGLGVVVFSIKFSSNLIRLIRRIQQNLKLKNKSYVNVLLSDKIVPHTFFNYLFFNKEEYLNKQIPSEVIVHEEAHAKQLHSLDILIMELLQIVFWFNPLIYLTKNAIKLNHEFLADQSVIKNGIETSIYQRTLLAFSSNAEASNLANAFNYSSIKKRFTVMKTQTSKTSFWVRSLLILPLMALLFYGFSDKEVVVKDGVDTPNTIQDTLPDKKLTLHIDGEIIIVNGKATNLKGFVKTMNQTTSDWTSEDFGLHRLEIKVADGVKDTFISKINEVFKETILAKKIKSNSPYIPLNKSLSFQDIATEKMVKEYNTLAKKYNSLPKKERTISREELGRMVYIFDRMTKEQRGRSEKFPEIIVPKNAPAPPMPTDGNNLEGIIPPPPPPTIEHYAPVAPQQVGDMVAPPPPPPPISAADFMRMLSKEGAVFFYKEKQISGKEAFDIATKNKEINIQVTDRNSKKPIVKLSKEPIELEDR